MTYRAPIYTEGLVPQGRLSLSSSKAVQTADVVGGTSVYYLPYVGVQTPIGPMPATGLSLALDSNSGHTGYQQSGKNFGLYLYLNGSTQQLCSGPAWTNDTTRANAIDQSTAPGLWVNTASIVLKPDASSSTITAAPGTAWYIGDMRATANGQSSLQFNPAAASGGSNTIVGLYNAYCKVPYFGTSRDSTSNWTYASSTYQNVNASAANRISFLDGLGDIATMAMYLVNSGSIAGNTNTDQKTGVKFNASGAGAPDLIGDVQMAGAAFGPYTSTTPFAVGKPTLGFNFWQAVEASSGTAGFFGNGFQMLMMAGSF